MPEPLLLAVALAVAGAVVLWPIRQPARTPTASDEADAAAVRHRVALEALRDVEADRRAGSLDEAAYAAQLAEAEERAAVTGTALDRQPEAAPPRAASGRPAVAAIGAAALIGAAMLAGSAVPATGVANRTVVNQALADAQAAESARQARIADLLGALAADPSSPDTLSDLADAYLEGGTSDDLVRAAVALRVLIELEPDRADAYERIITAYLRADDYANARAAHDSYASIEAADPVEVAFFDGLIALRGEDDPARAREAFDRFLELAPDDPRAGMIRGLRDEAARS